MKPFATLIIILLLAVAAGRPLAEEPEPRVSTEKISETLYFMQGRGGNVLASIGEDGVLLIDDDYAEYAPAYGEALAALGQKQPRYIINTHWHGDHTGGNAHWGGAGAVIIAHNRVLERLSTDQDRPSMGRVFPASPRIALPVVTFDDSTALHLNGDTLEVQHYPRGHTDGDSIVFFQKANVVHMGDHFFNGRFPFIDLASGGRVDNYIVNVAAVIQLVDEQTVIVPGHGPLANKADLQNYHNMLINTRAEVSDMREDGLGVEQMQARGLDARWESWGWKFINQDRWIATLASDS